MKRISMLGFDTLSSSAIATAGIMWPPVPPAANTTLRLFLVGLLGSCGVIWLSFVDSFIDRQHKILKDLCLVERERREGGEGEGEEEEEVRQDGIKASWWRW